MLSDSAKRLDSKLHSAFEEQGGDISRATARPADDFRWHVGGALNRVL